MLVTPPILEAFTLQEAKLRAGLDWVDGDPRDSLMTAFIAAARSQVERDTGVALLTQTHTVSLARYAGSTRPIALPWRPVVADEVPNFVVAFVTAAGSNLWDPSNYVLEPSSVDPTPARLSLVAGVWPAGLQVTMTVGLHTAEELQQQAPGLYHAVGLLIAHYATLGRDLATASGADLVPMGYADAIASYQLVVVP